MKLPDNAEVKPFEAANLGSLLVGRFNDAGPNFVAIRARQQISTGDLSSVLVILTPWTNEGEKLPYICAPEFGAKVLDLGIDWAFDVSVGEATPAFQGTPDDILVRSGPGFFIRLNRQGYLDVATGDVVGSPPNENEFATWSAFTIYLPQPDISGPGAVIMSWPQE